MANDKNLVPHQYTRNGSKARENGKIGGVKSGEARRAKRDAREIARFVLSLTPELPPMTLDAIKRLGVKEGVKLDMRLISTLAIQQKAMKGDLASYKFLVEMAGETAETQMLDAKVEEQSGDGMPIIINSRPTRDGGKNE